MAAGAFGGPVGIALGGLAGALLGGLAGGVTGTLAGAKIGEKLDQHILDDLECDHCGHTFRSNS
jgi:outer membrane lipoprotein SlyB